MANDLSSIGDLNILVGGDISPLQKALTQDAPSAAAAGAQAINQAFSVAAEAADVLTGRVNTASVAVEDMAGRVRNAGGALTTVAKSAETAATNLSKLGVASGALDEFIRKLQAASAQTETLTTRMQAAEGAVSGVSSAAASAATALARINAETTALSTTTTTVTTSTTAAAESTKSWSEQLSELGGSMIAGGAAITALTAPIAAIGYKSIETAGYFEQTRIAFTNLLGSAEQANRFIDQITQFAIRTPFEIKGLVDASRQMLAMGFQAEQLLPMLRTLGDAVAALGLGDAGIKRLTLAFGEMQARGTVAMKEMNQMAMAGIPAMDILAKGLDMTHRELMDAIKKRTVDAATAIPILLAGINQKFGGMMEAQAGTLFGMWSNIKDAATKTFLEIGNQILPTAKTIVAGIYPILSTVQDLAHVFGQLPEPIRVVTLGLGALVVAAGPLIMGLGTLAWSIGNIGTMVSTTSAAFARFTAAAAPAAASATALATAQNAVAVSAERVTVAETAAAASTVRWSAAAGTATTTTAAWGVEATTATVAMKAAAVESEAAASSMGTLAGATDKLAGIWAGLGPILRTVGWLGVAYEVWELVKAIGALNDARAADAAAGKGLDDQLTKMQIQLRQTGIDTAELDRQLRTGAIGFDDYLRAVQKLVVAFREAHPVANSAASALSSLSPELRRLAEAQDKANDSLEKSKAVLDEAKAAYAAGKISVDVLREAQAEYNKALQDAHGKQTSHIKDLQDIRTATAAASAEVQRAQTIYETTRAAFDKGKATWAEVQATWDQYAKAAKAAGVAVNDVQHSVDAAKQSAQAQIETLKTAIDTYNRFAETSTGTAAEQLAWSEALKKVETAAKAVGLAVDDLGGQLRFSVSEKAKEAGTAVAGLADIMNKQAGYAASELGVIINGKLVQPLAELTAQSIAAGQQLGSMKSAMVDVKSFTDEAGHAVDGFGTAIDVAAGKVQVLQGSVTAAAQAIGGLDTKIIEADGSITTQAALLEKLAGAYNSAAAAAGGLASATGAAGSATNAFGGNSSWWNQGSLQGTHASVDYADWLAMLVNTMSSGNGFGLSSTPLTTADWARRQLSQMGYHLEESGSGGYKAVQDYEGATSIIKKGALAAHDSLATLATTTETVTSTLTGLNTSALGDVDAYEQAKSATIGASTSLANLASSVSTASAGLDKVSDAAGQMAAGGVLAAAAIQTVAAAAVEQAQATMAVTGVLFEGLGGAATPASTGSTLNATMPGFAATRPEDALRTAQIAQQTAAANSALMAAGHVSITAQVQAGSVVGRNGMEELADEVTNRIVQRLRQVTGLKLT